MARIYLTYKFHKNEKTAQRRGRCRPGPGSGFQISQLQALPGESAAAAAAAAESGVRVGLNGIISDNFQ